jgi:hypothetical protein
MFGFIAVFLLNQKTRKSIQSLPFTQVLDSQNPASRFHKCLRVLRFDVFFEADYGYARTSPLDERAYNGTPASPPLWFQRPGFNVDRVVSSGPLREWSGVPHRSTRTHDLDSIAACAGAFASSIGCTSGSRASIANRVWNLWRLRGLCVRNCGGAFHRRIQFRRIL